MNPVPSSPLANNVATVPWRPVNKNALNASLNFKIFSIKFIVHESLTQVLKLVLCSDVFE